MKKEGIKLIRKVDLSRPANTGTGLIGYLLLSYRQIKAIFGEPNSHGDGYKTDWEWILKLNNSIITIYNYKDGPNYTRNLKIKKTDVEWHIGGVYKYDTKILHDYIVQEKPKLKGEIFIQEA